MRTTTRAAILALMHVLMALFGVVGSYIVMQTGASDGSWLALASGFLGMLICIAGIVAWVFFWQSVRQEEAAGP